MFPPNTVHVYDYDDSGVEMIRVGAQPAQPLEWLWPNRIPIGKVTLLVGDPGCGKSLVALDIAARTTRATPWPDEQQGARSVEQGGMSGTQSAENGNSVSPLPAPCSLPSDSMLPAPCSVLLLSAEDDLTDTIRPRLDAAGADANRIFILPAIADLRHDFAQLEAAVNRAPDCRLIIVDPINAYIGPNDSHFQTVVRKVLAPLARLAAERRIAVLAVAHFRKTHGAAIYRAAGSMGFVSAARAVWTVCPDHSQPGNHFFLPLKTNLTAAACGLAYTIETHPSGSPFIRWNASPVHIAAEVALAPRPKPRPEPATERSAARQWLREVLAAGPRPASEVLDEGKQRGFLSRTLQRAFHEMDGHTAKKGLLRGWWWSLNDQSSVETTDDTQKTADAFEGVTYEKDIADQRGYDNLFRHIPPIMYSEPPPKPPNAISDAKFNAFLARLKKESRQSTETPNDSPAPKSSRRPNPDTS